ncbi:hypothetical protein ABH942_003249 [Flavobacterium sp. 28YEA47A]|uniref:hypothetical protein n=1 Tax=Flavobacterium sp. 28YEA47A TaxID=3156276 RepID=UPI0035175F0E
MNLKNKAINFLFPIVGLLCFSCKEKDKKSEIEIYTLKSSDEKIEVPYDSVKKEFIYAPKFEVTKNLLNENPLIVSKEVLCLDTLSGKIELSAEAINKIISLKSSMKHGIKFAICQDKEPIFTGYFWSSLSSYGSTWNCIEYNHSKKVSSSVKLNIYKSNGMNISKREKINFSTYPELIKYLTESNKLECNK